jgi:DNA-nicking Smr family endonuclease
MQTLDLHGTPHRDANEKTRSFLNFAELPCQVITGNSTRMKYIVRIVVKEYGWICYEKDSYNYGTLIVLEKEIR